LVLLHPAGAAGFVWSPIIEALSQHRRVYALDTIGELGRSELEDYDRYARRGLDFTAWLADTYHQLDITAAEVVGALMGGWIALQQAIHAPERVERLVLLGSSVRRAGSRHPAALRRGSRPRAGRHHRAGRGATDRRSPPQVRVVLDTNVLISAFVFPGSAPGQVYRRVLEGRVILVTSRPLLSELGRVLTEKLTGSRRMPKRWWPSSYPSP
jgi:pimeloyl-ACP methyl ester carboxylesterase